MAKTRYICKTWGYVFIKVDGRWVREHRYVMEQHLGRKLKRGELVHHINEDKTDNRLENLELTTFSEHPRKHRRKHTEETKAEMRKAALDLITPEERVRRSERAKAQHQDRNFGHRRQYPCE